MGLAASQARFLAITARKMNCEFQSMQIAQEKLSVTRDMQKAAQNYQTALDATKFVWDCDNDVYDLSYGVMMTPSMLNEFTPFLVTDTRGKIVLTDHMFDAAFDAGIIDENGEPKVSPFMGEADMSNPANQKNGSRNAFLYQLGQSNQISGSTVDAILGLGENGYTRSGIGGPIYNKSRANALTTGAFINYMQNMTYRDLLKTDENLTIEDIEANYKSIFGDDAVFDASSKIYSFKVTDLFKDSSGNSLLSTNKKDMEKPEGAGKFYITRNGSCISSLDTLENITLGDILTGNYEICYHPKNSDYNYTSTGATDPNGKGAKQVFRELITRMARILGYGSVESRGLNVDTDSDSALEQALNMTLTLLSTPKEEKINYASSSNDAASKCNQVIKGKRDIYSLSITNMLKSFLTYFALSLDGFDCGFVVEKTSSKQSDYVTDDGDYYFLLKNDAAKDDQNMLNADFYNMLYNQIAMHGACTDESKRDMVTDKDYLQQAIKNGQLFISALSSDGYFYQRPYALLSDYIAEVPDEDAIQRAEVEYNITKSKLNAKEETLELKMKNLDMEISSLTTEFDTVKNLISKNVEKVFTMFST